MTIPLNTRDVLLVDNDITIQNGDLSFVSGIDAIAQACKLMVQLFAGEWFLDQTLGIPYFEDIFIKNPNVPAIREIFKQKLLTVVGILDVLQINLSFESVRRTLTIRFRCSTDLGEINEQIVLTR